MATQHDDYPYEPDQFDLEADRVGAHGAHREDVPLWKQNFSYLLIALAAVVVIVGSLIAVNMIGREPAPSASPAVQTSAPAASDNGQGSDESETESSRDEQEPSTQEPSEDETEEPAAEPDFSRPVLVLNGTRTNGLAGQWARVLENEGWQQVDTDTGQRADSAGVYYKAQEDAATAQALAELLGVEAEMSEDYPSSITVVVVSAPQE